MNNHAKKLRVKLPALFLFMALLFLFLPRSLQARQDQVDDLKKRLEYEVSVSAQLVPLFAVDSRGNPAYGLKKEEFELYVDGEPTEIIFFSGYRLEASEQGKHPSKTPAVKYPERINFIILDSLITNRNTLPIGRVVAMEIIKNASPGDSFVILESNQVSGFQYVIGPEKDKKKLAGALAEIENRYMRRRVFMTRTGPQESTVGPIMEHGLDHAFEMEVRLFLMDFNRAKKEKARYEQDITIFTRSLQQLKYVLKTITLPKTVYLISAGTMNSLLFWAIPTRGHYYRFLEDAAEAVNRGGALFYLVNPLTHQYLPRRIYALINGKIPTLKFMADHVGGKFITGSTLKEIIDTTKKSTSAYYEMAFYPGKKSKDKVRIRLKCKRKGVGLTTINYSERNKPYRQMNFTEKKLFAINVVNGGSWSRMVARVGKIDYKNLAALPKIGTAKDSKTIEIRVPPNMRNRRLDFFQVGIDPLTGKAEIVFDRKKMGAKESIRMKVREDKRHYFVIVEPAKPFCIYNRVI